MLVHLQFCCGVIFQPYPQQNSLRQDQVHSADVVYSLPQRFFKFPAALQKFLHAGAGILRRKDNGVWAVDMDESGDLLI